jgi:O-antigen ligase
MAHLVIGTICLTLPLALVVSRVTADPATATKTLAVQILGAGLLLSMALGIPRGALARRTAVTLLPLAAWALWLLLSASLSALPLTSLVALWPTLVGLGVFAAVQMFPPASGRISAWWLWLGVAALGTIALALWSPPWIRYALEGYPDRYHFASTFGNPLSHAEFLAPVLCLGLAAVLGLVRRRVLLAVLLAGPLALGLWVLLQTASRGPALGLVAGVAAVAVLAPRSRARSARALLLVAGACAALGLAHWVLGPRSPAHALGGRLAEGLELRSRNIHMRLTTWTLASQMIWRAPVMGHGWGMFEFLFHDELARNLSDDPEGLWELEAAFLDGWIHYHAHSDYLEIAVASGLVGLALFLWILSQSLAAGVLALGSLAQPDRWLISGALGAVVCFLVMAAVTFPLQRPAQLAVFWLTLGVCRAAPRLASGPRA